MKITRENIKNFDILITTVNRKLSVKEVLEYIKKLGSEQNFSKEKLLNYTKMLKVLADREKYGSDADEESAFSDLRRMVMSEGSVDLREFSFLNPDLLFEIQKSKSKKEFYLNGEVIKVKAKLTFPDIDESNFKFLN